MKKLFILFFVLCFVNLSASAEILNYRIQQNGNSMVIVPFYSTPETITPVAPNIETSPVKIPYYSSKKLPKGKNRTRSV